MKDNNKSFFKSTYLKFILIIIISFITLFGWIFLIEYSVDMCFESAEQISNDPEISAQIDSIATELGKETKELTKSLESTWDAFKEGYNEETK